MQTLRLQIIWTLAVLLRAGPDPFVGLWKFDYFSSTFTMGDPGIMCATIQIESVGAALRWTYSGADGKGLASDFTFSCLLDGTPCHVVAAMPMNGASAVDTISLKRIDPRVIEAAGMKNGKVIYADRRVVSIDGQTMTVSRNGTTPQGRKYESVIVLIRSH